jgi:hypothetical protein
MVFTHHELCEAMRESIFPFTDAKNQFNVLKNFILSDESVVSYPSAEVELELLQKLNTFLAHAIQRYKKATGNFTKFLKQNDQFLNNEFPLPISLWKMQQLSSDEESPIKKYLKASGPRKAGRPSIPFEDKSERAKQLDSAKIRMEFAPGAIFRAAAQQSGPKGKLMRAVDSETGLTAARALEAVKGDPRPGLIFHLIYFHLKLIYVSKVTLQYHLHCYNYKGRLLHQE